MLIPTKFISVSACRKYQKQYLGCYTNIDTAIRVVHNLPDLAGPKWKCLEITSNLQDKRRVLCQQELIALQENPVKPLSRKIIIQPTAHSVTNVFK